jgi:hypothetical protein
VGCVTLTVHEIDRERLIGKRHQNLLSVDSKKIRSSVPAVVSASLQANHRHNEKRNIGFPKKK